MMRGASSFGADVIAAVTSTDMGATPNRSGASCPRPWLYSWLSYQPNRRTDERWPAIDEPRPQLDKVGACSDRGSGLLARGDPARGEDCQPVTDRFANAGQSFQEAREERTPGESSRLGQELRW